MTTPPQENSQPVTENKQSDKELNFRMLEQRYKNELMKEKSAREELEKRIQQSQRAPIEEEDESDPYVDHKRLQKKLAHSETRVLEQTQTEIKKAVNQALHEERKANYIKQNADYFEVLGHADKLHAADPELAESILDMPEGFERQKLVYKSIKALGLHKEKAQTPSVQDKIDANRKGAYYQPAGVGAAPYSSQSDFSQSGQKQAYAKMQELKSRLRL